MATNEWLTPLEAGAILGVGPDRVAQLACNGVLVSMRAPGGHLRLRRELIHHSSGYKTYSTTGREGHQTAFNSSVSDSDDSGSHVAIQPGRTYCLGPRHDRGETGLRPTHDRIKSSISHRSWP